MRPFVAILRDALSPPHLFPPLLFLYMPSYLKLDSWRAVKNLAAQADHDSHVEPAVLASTHLTTTVIKCAAVMTSCFDDTSYLTQSLVVGKSISLLPREKKKEGEGKRNGSRASFGNTENAFNIYNNLKICRITNYKRHLRDLIQYINIFARVFL